MSKVLKYIIGRAIRLFVFIAIGFVLIEFLFLGEIGMRKLLFQAVCLTIILEVISCFEMNRLLKGWEVKNISDLFVGEARTVNLYTVLTFQEIKEILLKNNFNISDLEESENHVTVKKKTGLLWNKNEYGAILNYGKDRTLKGIRQNFVCRREKVL